MPRVHVPEEHAADPSAYVWSHYAPEIGAAAGLRPQDLDSVVYYETPYAKVERLLVSTIRAFPRAWRQFPKAMAAQAHSGRSGR